MTFLFFLSFSRWLHVPSFSIMLISVLLLFSPSFPISPCKTTSLSPLWFLLFGHFLAFLFSFFYQLNSIPLDCNCSTVADVNTPFTCCCRGAVFDGLNGEIPIKSGFEQGTLLKLCLPLCLSMGSVAEANFLSNGVLSNTVCCV